MTPGTQLVLPSMKSQGQFGKESYDFRNSLDKAGLLIRILFGSNASESRGKTSQPRVVLSDFPTNIRRRQPQRAADGIRLDFCRFISGTPTSDIFQGSSEAGKDGKKNPVKWWSW